MTRGVTAFAVVLCLVVPALALADESAPDAKAGNESDAIALLGRAAKAVRRVTYRGTIVYLRNGDVDTLQVVHRLHDGIEQERLVSQSGEAREVIRKGDDVTSILPDHHLVLVSEHPPKTLLGSVANFSPKELRTYYQVSESSTVRFAGRQCRVIEIKPKDKYRYGYRMFVDSQTDLPLKLALRYDGNRLEQLMFTDIEFPKHVSDDDFVASYDVRGYKIVRHQAVELAATEDDATDAHSNWQVGNLPPGFHLAEDGVRHVGKGVSVRQMLFTDGVATVSAFVAPAGLRPPLKGATRMGAVNAFGHIVDQSQITVVGEVPGVTAEQIATHITHSTKH